jgi:hypothetical protein
MKGMRILSFLTLVGSLAFANSVVQASPPGWSCQEGDYASWDCTWVHETTRTCGQQETTCYSECGDMGVEEFDCVSEGNPGHEGHQEGHCFCIPQCAPGSACYCVLHGGTMIGDTCYPPNSPILINLDGNTSNYHLTSANDGVKFDISGQRVAEQISWTRANSSVAFLVLDRDGNGTIDSGKELFGNATPRPSGGRYENGFEALKEFDGNGDGSVDDNDPMFGQLRLWLDANHNGLSEPSELLTLTKSKIASLSTTYREGHRVDQHGNQYKFVGTALIDKRRRDVTLRIFDVFFVRADTDQP